MREVDESKLIKDIENGKYPLVKFINSHSDVFITGNSNSDEVKIRGLETRNYYDLSLTHVVYNNPNSKIFIYRQGPNPYWFFKSNMYDPYTFELKLKNSKCLKVAIIPLTQSEVEYELAKGLTTHLNKEKYKLLLIS